MADDDVTPIDIARRRKEAEEVMRALQLPDAPRVGTIVRRARLGEFCLHRETELDTTARIIRCRGCGADLDPIEVLGTIANEWDRLAWAVTEHREIAGKVRELRAEEKRIKARLRTARAKLPAVDGELAALRLLESAVRASAVRPAVFKALRALDAAREAAADG